MRNIFLYIAVSGLIFSSCSRETSTSGKQTTTSEIATTDNTSQPEKVAQDLRKTSKDKVSSDIKWLSYDEAIKLSEKEPRKIFIDVYTDWCGWCKRMDRTTLKDDNVGKYINQYYYPVKVNAESQKKVTYKGKQMTEQELALNVFGATGYPTTVYLENDQTMLQAIPGYLEAEMLNKVLRYFGEDHYKTTSWEKFQASASDNITNSTKE
ncbi:MAG TPA: thioredoxin fold domain-containing protein [Cytophagaceae bacterium]